MKAARFYRHGGVDALQIDDIEAPLPGPGEVQVRVRAAALNGFDPMMLAGSTGLKSPLPLCPCGDFAGEISALGPDLSGDWREGDRISGYPILPKSGMMGEVAQGAAREYLVLPESCLLPMPDGVSFEQAAALPVAYGTALRMMVTRGAVRAGERVLILGASGGVGVACVQLAHAVGAEVIACGSGAWKLDRLREIGADHVIDTAQENFASAVRERFGKPAYDGSGDGGVDVLVNYIGGDTWAAGLKTLRQHGRVLVCGATAGHDPATDLRYIWSFEQTVVGSNGWTPTDQAELLQRVARAELKPVIHAARPVDEIATAMQELIDRRVIGKSVLTL
ncbi:MAG: zinc-binding dehydrogenase [Pseudomonadota bacterium]